jgi:hypothetical protein
MLLISITYWLRTTRLSTTIIMHLTKILSSILLAVTASAAPLVSPEVSLSKRQATSDGQAGAYISSPDGVAFTSVLGAVSMPDLGNANSGTQVSYWIGIDGIDDGSNLDQIVIQAGFDAVKQADGSTTYTAFYEWYPNPATFISATDFTAAAGEAVEITVAISGAGTTAEAAFVNRQTQQAYSVQFFSPGEEYDSRGANAQWVIERAPGTTLANFGEIKFVDSSAGANGNSYGTQGGTSVNLVDNGNTLSTGAINGNSEVVTAYTGP